MKRPLLLLAGLDPTGGAGLIADAVTARDLGCHPLGIPSMLTVQNSLRFESAEAIAPTYIEQALAALAAEFSFDTAKVGLVPVKDAAWLGAVGALIRKQCRRIVVDPVLRPTAATEGTMRGAAYLSFVADTVITPNLRELTLLAEATDIGENEFPKTVLALAKRLNAAVVVTFEGKTSHILVAEKGSTIEVPVTLLPTERPVHGTGCRFSTAIACGLAQGKTLPEAVAAAAAYLTEAIRRRERFHPYGQEFL